MTIRYGLSSLDGLSSGLTHVELRGRLTRVLQFAATNLDGLDVYSRFWEEEQPTPKKDEPAALVNQADKVIVEAALLALIASTVINKADPENAALDSLIEKVKVCARSERVQVLFLRFPHTAASLGIAHVILSRLGHGDERFDALVRAALESGHAEAVERLPYRTMDLRWLLGIMNPATAPKFDDLLPHSILTSCVHPIYASDLDVYAITHGIMYLTDFGRHELPYSLDPQRLGQMIDSCLAWHILSNNFDLLGELLLSAACIPNAWSPYTGLAWRLLASMWDELGFLPSCTFDSARYAELSGERASAYAFLHIYHTTFVAGLLCAVLLRHPQTGDDTDVWAPAPAISADLLERAELAVLNAHDFCSHHGMRTDQLSEQDDPTGDRLIEPPDELSIYEKTVNRIRNYPGPCSLPDAGWADAAKTTAWHSTEVALVLNDALIIQAARDYQVPLLVSALLDRADSDLPLSATVLEALAFLIRQQLPSGAIGAHFVIPDNCQSSAAPEITQSMASCIARLILHVCESSKQVSTLALAAR
jgi:hypothetical protein